MNKIRITAENQRRYIIQTYDSAAFSEDLTETEIIKICLGDFYLFQSTYTRVTKIELIDGNGNIKVILEKNRR